MTITTANIAMLHLFEQAHIDIHEEHRHLPYNNFMNSLEQWCETNGQDIVKWRTSMHRLFTLKHTTKIPAKEAVRYVVSLDKAKLGLN